MARNSPVTICKPRHIPRRDPKFHHDEIFEGVGRSINALFIILKSGCFFIIFIKIFVVGVRMLRW